MNLDRQLKTILCYGDSNTWGFVPTNHYGKTMTVQRYGKDIRWPGRLQHLLGSSYYVIEEGLNGRTTNLDYNLPPDRNGKTYLPPCLYTHAPIDLVILTLGGNDLKACFNRTASDIYQGLASLVEIIQTSNYGTKLQQAPKVLIVYQFMPLSICEQLVDDKGTFIFQGAVDKAKSALSLYSQLAQQTASYFLDSSANIRPSGIDGIHLDKQGHKAFALLVKHKVSDIFEK
jgi:lysophospholipase L1-like esterase